MSQWSYFFRIMILDFREYELQLQNTFTTAHSQRDSQQSIIVSLSHDGVTGYGETTVNTYYGITLEMILTDLERARYAIQDIDLNTPEDLHHYLATETDIHNFPLCAIDEAAYDCFGKMHGQPTHAFLGSHGGPIPMTDFTIGIDSVEHMVGKMLDFPWPIYKIKLGTGDDIRIVRELRRHTEAIFRVDANCGWTADEAIKNSTALAELGVEFIEQPLDPADYEGMKEVFEASALPVIADESCQTEEDVATCVGLFHGINIKLTKCGGITPARRMIEHARSENMNVMAGCMTESSVGISALCQLAPLLDYLDADGTLLITNDPARGVTFVNGSIVYSEIGGNGVELFD